MKIYNEIVFDVDGNVIYEDSYEHSGDMMLCTRVKPEYWQELGFESYDDWQASLDLSNQEQASDIQLNAVPSLPDVSNIGSFAPSGVVNWNTIPGGFQPLPQTAGRGKKLYQLSQFHGGINQKSSPRDISDNECQEAINITVSEIGRIKLLGDCLNEYNSLK